MKCLLCHSNNLKDLYEIKLKDLNEIYNKYYDIEVSYLFKADLIKLVECGDCSLRFFDPTVPGDEAFYNKLQKLSFYYADDKAEFDFAIKKIKPGSKVLEVGSGRGNFAKKIQNCDYTGLDFSIKAKEMAAKDGITIINQSVEDHVLEHKEEYDIVCSFQVLEHVTDVNGYLKACVNALKPGGMMIHSVPSEDSYLSIAPNDILNHPPHHCSRWQDVTFKNVARIFNLELSEIFHEKLNPIHRDFYRQTMILQKILKTINYQYKPIDNNFIFKIANKISAMLSAKTNNKVIPESVYGNSVTAVFKKKS